LRLAAAGHRIAVNYNTHPEDAEDVANEIRSGGGEAIIVGADVSDRAAVEEMFRETTDKLGPVEILVNNAGIIQDSLLMRMKDDAFKRVLDTNIYGTYFCSRMAVAPMVRGRWGRIINVTSVVGIRGNVGQTNYASSKAAVHGFTKSLAKEVATRNVTVNAVAPGYVSTATTNVLPQKVKDKVLTWIPFGRFGTPDEIAPTIAFVASEDARYMTGCVIPVDGGMAI
jgi:3-oxoacyl-[acyl-carrier protein] reductase